MVHRMSFLTVVVLVALAIPLAGRFVPGARPWLDKAGLLQPLTAVGVVPAAEAWSSCRARERLVLPTPLAPTNTVSRPVGNRIERRDL